MKRIALLSLSLLVLGCATSKTTYLPDGSQGHSIDCSGEASTWNHCYEKAGELCGARGYEVVAKDGDQGSVITGNNIGVYGGTTQTRSMLVKCKS
jgi:hypothetical protein